MRTNEAYNICHKARKTKKQIRPNKCSRCNVECKPHGHHTDYDKPLEVIWLCPKCHKEEHKKYGQGKNFEASPPKCHSGHIIRIGMNIKLERTRQKMTQGDLALKANISQNTLCQIEGDNQSPNIETLEKIAAGLNMTVSELTKEDA